MLWRGKKDPPTTSIQGDSSGNVLVFAEVRDAITAGFLSGTTVTVEDAEGNEASGVSSGGDTRGRANLGRYPPGTLLRVTASLDGYANVNRTFLLTPRDVAPGCEVRRRSRRKWRISFFCLLQYFFQ